ncbi:DUF3892 domain-containing protein [Rhodoblastus acidophilus]|nr:DUF3892 domain-containing protein [Rhodoblastus acidophilus]
MTISVEIKCINKSDRQNAHERIKNVGGINGDGSRWRLTEDAAIAGMKDGKWSFWTNGGGRTAKVIIARSAGGKEYLKTESDGVHPNNLLALPECP